MSLAGKNVVVVGGSSGIGLAVAVAFAEAGGRVAVAGRTESKLREAAQAWQGSPAMETYQADAADRASVAQLFQWARQTLGPIDVLVISAGVNVPNRSMAQMRPEDWDHVLQINATGAYNCMHAVLPDMRARREGLIVNISSVSGKRATELGGVAYCASKFAQTALGIAVANEVGLDGVRVTNIYPGEVDTPILAQRPTPVTAEHRTKILQPSDIATAVLMIASLPPRAHVPEMVIKPTEQPYA